MPARVRSRERPPSAAMSSRAAIVVPEPSRQATSARPTVKSSTLSGATMTAPAASALSRSAPTMSAFITMWAKASPSFARPSKVRKTGRTASPVRLSVITISVIGCALPAISSQTPSWSSMRRPAAAIAEARVSRPIASGGVASTTVTARPGSARRSASASDRPTWPPPAISTSTRSGRPSPSPVCPEPLSLSCRYASLPSAINAKPHRSEPRPPCQTPAPRLAEPSSRSSRKSPRHSGARISSAPTTRQVGMPWGAQRTRVA